LLRRQARGDRIGRGDLTSRGIAAHMSTNEGVRIGGDRTSQPAICTSDADERCRPWGRAGGGTVQSVPPMVGTVTCASLPRIIATSGRLRPQCGGGRSSAEDKNGSQSIGSRIRQPSLPASSERA
jgi:hypothetical protein